MVRWHVLCSCQKLDPFVELYSFCMLLPPMTESQKNKRHPRSPFLAPSVSGVVHKSVQRCLQRLSRLQGGRNYVSLDLAARRFQSRNGMIHVAAGSLDAMRCLAQSIATITSSLMSASFDDEKV